jgi:hypothetical protein
MKGLFPSALAYAQAQLKEAGKPAHTYFERGKSAEEMVKEFKRDLAEWAEREYGGMTKAAEALEVGSRKTLYDWKKL